MILKNGMIMLWLAKKLVPLQGQKQLNAAVKSSLYVVIS